MADRKGTPTPRRVTEFDLCSLLQDEKNQRRRRPGQHQGTGVNLSMKLTRLVFFPPIFFEYVFTLASDVTFVSFHKSPFLRDSKKDEEEKKIVSSSFSLRPFTHFYCLSFAYNILI